MAIQSSFYLVDGSTRTFPSTKHIATKQHCAIYVKDITLLTWSAVATDDYILINNSIVFDTAPSSALYSELEVRVADTQGELVSSPSDIAIVAGDTVAINTVSTNIASINTASSNIGAINTTSGSIANVNITATNIASVNAVAADLANIDAVVLNAANVNAVASDLLEPTSEINTVALSISNVDLVGGSITNVNTVATSIANINSVAITIVPNIVEILLADDNATIATTQAGISTTKAAEAAASAASIDPLTLVHQDSSTGAAFIPSGTTAQRPAIPANGYMRYNTDLQSAEVYSNGAWGSVGGGATGGGTDHVFVNTEYTINNSYLIPAGKSSVIVSDSSNNVYFATGVQIDFSTGSKVVIL